MENFVRENICNHFYYVMFVLSKSYLHFWRNGLAKLKTQLKDVTQNSNIQTPDWIVLNILIFVKNVKSSMKAKDRISTKLYQFGKLSEFSWRYPVFRT